MYIFITKKNTKYKQVLHYEDTARDSSSYRIRFSRLPCRRIARFPHDPYVCDVTIHGVMDHLESDWSLESSSMCVHHVQLARQILFFPAHT